MHSVLFAREFCVPSRYVLPVAEPACEGKMIYRINAALELQQVAAAYEAVAKFAVWPGHAVSVLELDGQFGLAAVFVNGSTEEAGDLLRALHSAGVESVLVEVLAAPLRLMVTSTIGSRLRREANQDPHARVQEVLGVEELLDAINNWSGATRAKDDDSTIMTSGGQPTDEIAPPVIQKQLPLGQA